MMETVHEDLLCSEDIIECAVFVNGDAVGQFLPVGILRVLDGWRGNILHHMPVECHGQCLHASADAQNGYLSVIGQVGKHQFCLVAVGVNAAQAGRRVFAAPQGIDVCTAAEQQSVEMFQCVYQHILVGHGRYQYRSASCFDHLFIVFVAQ